MTRLVAEVAENYYRLLALDQRLEILDKTIELQAKSLEVSKAFKDAGRLTELPVQRFQAEVRKNQSEKLIVQQEVIEAENRINFLTNRFPTPVDRVSAGFFDLTIRPLSVGLPSQLLLNRADIRQAERELAAAGLEVKVAGPASTRPFQSAPAWDTRRSIPGTFSIRKRSPPISRETWSRR